MLPGVILVPPPTGPGFVHHAPLRPHILGSALPARSKLLHWTQAGGIRFRRDRRRLDSAERAARSCTKTRGQLPRADNNALLIGRTGYGEGCQTSGDTD